MSRPLSSCSIAGSPFRTCTPSRPESADRIFTPIVQSGMRDKNNSGSRPRHGRGRSSPPDSRPQQSSSSSSCQPLKRLMIIASLYKLWPMHDSVWMQVIGKAAFARLGTPLISCAACMLSSSTRRRHCGHWISVKPPYSTPKVLSFSHCLTMDQPRTPIPNSAQLHGIGNTPHWLSSRLPLLLKGSFQLWLSELFLRAHKRNFEPNSFKLH